jgi:glycosyltransferase involved in cell wall biosynthesis
VFVVRSCLDLSNVRISAKKSDLKCGRRYLVVYLGVINQQDGVDLLLEAIAAIVHQQHRSDTHFSLIGSGTEIPRLKRLVVDKALDGFVTFTGWKTGQELEEYLSTADVAVAPDPATPLNDKSTMNKILHYMAYGLPIVQYDLTEGRRSAEDASLYARNDDPQEFARKIVSLLDSESLRKELGSNGRRRIEGKLNWSNEQQELLRAYDVLLERRTDKAKADSGKACIGKTRSATFPEVPKYVIVTPARDEQAHIEKTICAVIAQTIRPERWVIVNDGSQDGTGAIIDRYASLHPWIVPVHRANRGYRHAGGGVVDAFYDGYAQVKSMDWDFIVKLDADLGFAPDYFERCFDEFAADAQLGIAGGGIYHHASDGLKLEPTPLFHVRGATKIYRHDCWVQLGGLIAAPGWDTIDEAKANMLGWRTRTFPNLQVAHHRPTGSADGAWKDSVKNGRANYISGYHPLFMLFKCLRRLHRRPYVLGAAGLFWGFLSGYLNRTAQVEDRLLIRYIRTQQLRRMFLLGTIWR